MGQPCRNSWWDCEKAIAHFERPLRNEVDVIAAKWIQEGLQPQSMKQITKIKRDKGLKKSRRRQLDFHDFSILKTQGPHLILVDIGTKKVDITIGQLIAMVSSVWKKLKRSLST